MNHGYKSVDIIRGYFRVPGKHEEDREEGNNQRHEEKFHDLRNVD